ncbi:MAG: 23S rRNA pseudouridine1911/1915/1917 synthase [Candidatus Promineifilaceae bacterium]|jgi:23S rRNA pseudouridine1911/1915/1917 synthase
MKNEFVARQRDSGKPLIEFLAYQLNCSNNKAKAVLDSRSVTINGRRVWMARHKLKPGDKILVVSADERTTTKIRVLLKGANYIIVNKPPRQLTQGPKSVETTLREQLENPALRAAHRLDRDTSGCLIFAKSDAAGDAIRKVFYRRDVLKKYEAIVLGHLPKVQRTIKADIDGLDAVTHYRVIRSNQEASYIRVRIETGRTHQIRKHFADMKHPVLGDKAYFLRKMSDPRLLGLGRQMLHANYLAFVDPLDKRQIEVNAPLPKDFRDCLKAFKLG